MEFVPKEDIPYFTGCEPLVEGFGFKLVNLESVNRKDGMQFKAVIKSDKGIGIKDCATVHRAILPRLEALTGSQEIAVEVSSPGINRIIKRSVEFYAFIGEDAEIWDSNITDWRKGIIKEVSPKGVLLASESEDILIPFENIKKARCNF